MWFDTVLIEAISCTACAMIYVNVNTKLQSALISLQLLLKSTYELHCHGNKANEKAAGNNAVVFITVKGMDRRSVGYTVLYKVY